MKRFSKGICLTVVAMLLSVLVLMGCGGTSQEPESIPETETMSQPETVEVVKYASLGEETEGSIQIKLTNKLGKNITAFSVETEGKEPEALLQDDVFAADETRILNYKPEEGKKYNVLLKYGAEDKETVLHDFPMNDAGEADLLLSEEIGYIKYQSLTTGEEKSSLENEKSLIVPEETTAAYVEPEYYYEPVYYEEPVYYAPQGDDGCIDDGLMW